MKAVIQRVSQAKVMVDQKTVAEIRHGLLVLLGVTLSDTSEKARWLAQKIVNIRIFSDNEGKMNLCLKDIGGEVLVVSQFTLYSESQKGNRPSFTAAAKPEVAKTLYNLFVEDLRGMGVKVETGKFGTMMQVHLVNDGPVTIILEK